jgi:hypothetical protein
MLVPHNEAVNTRRYKYGEVVRYLTVASLNIQLESSQVLREQFTRT